MSRHEETCPHCRAKQAGDDAAAEGQQQEIALPSVPTPIRVHTADFPPFDCTLHPDGTLTAVLGGEVRRDSLTLAEMRERNWQGAYIELNPEPLTEAVPEQDEAVQEALI